MSTIAAPVLALVFVSGALAADFQPGEMIDLHTVVGLDAPLQGYADSSGFGPSAVTGSNDPLMTPTVVPFDSGNAQAPNPVPLPWSGGLGAVGLATLAMRRRRRAKLA